MNAPVLHDPGTEVPWTGIRVTGSDARHYLQGQLSCDVFADAHSGLLLHPSGEVITDVDISYDEDVLLTVRSELAEEAMVRLQRFILRSDVQISLCDAAMKPYEIVGEQVALGRPGPMEFANPLAPQAFGAAFVRERVSFTKGCFTGQELVGRLDARGANIPFHLIRLRGTDSTEANELVRSSGPEGERAWQMITTAVATPAGFEALAIAHRSLDLTEPRISATML